MSGTLNAAGYCELYPLYICRYLPIIKYWLKSNKNRYTIIKTVHNISFEDSHNGKKTRDSRVEKLSCDPGFNCVFESPLFVNEKSFVVYLGKG